MDRVRYCVNIDSFVSSYNLQISIEADGAPFTLASVSALFKATLNRGKLEQTLESLP